MSDKTPTTYSAKCHCGLIRYTVTLPDALAPKGSGKIGKCNCSICTKNGYLLVYPYRKDVHFQDGCDAKLKDYFFGKKRKPHKYCPDCSSSIMIDFKNSDIEGQKEFLAMNVRSAGLSRYSTVTADDDDSQSRMFDDIDFDQAVFSPFDGRNKLDPPYQA